MLLEKYLPAYTYREYHEIGVSASGTRAYYAARHLDFSESQTIQTLFQLRGLPTDDMTIEGFTRRVNFTLLEEIQNDEFVIGFWAKHGVEKISDRNRFARDHTSMPLKVAWNFKVREIAPSRVRVSTETRILCTNPRTLVFFSLYWAVVRPFSGLIRKKMLGLIKARAEHATNESSF